MRRRQRAAPGQAAPGHRRRRACARVGDPGKPQQSCQAARVQVTAMADKDAQRFEAQGNVLLAKLNALGDGGSLHLGPEATAVVTWLLEQGLVEVENLGSNQFVIRAPKPSART
jgi:hypothetical protein